LVIAAVANSGMIAASSATGGLSADLFQVFAIEAVGVSPAVVGAVLAAGSVTFLAQVWYSRHPMVVRDAANVRYSYAVAALGSVVLALAVSGWATPAVRTAFLLAGFLVVELGISLFWVAGWWPLVTRVIPAGLKPVPRIRLTTRIASLVLYLVIGLAIGHSMSGPEGAWLMLCVAGYFVAARFAVGRLDTAPAPPAAPDAPATPDPVAADRRPSGEAAGGPGGAETARAGPDPGADLRRQVSRLVVPMIFLGPALLTTFLIVRFDATPQQIGVLLSVRTAGGVAGSMLMAWITIPSRRSLPWGLLLGAAGVLAFAAAALVPDAWIAFALLGGVALAFADSVVSVAVIETATTTLPPADRGRFFLWQDAILTCTSQVSSLLVGLLLSMGRAGTTGYVIYLSLAAVAAGVAALRYGARSATPALRQRS
jgi:hypothetical protein